MFVIPIGPYSLFRTDENVGLSGVARPDSEVLYPLNELLKLEYWFSFAVVFGSSYRSPIPNPPTVLDVFPMLPENVDS